MTLEQWRKEIHGEVFRLYQGNPLSLDLLLTAVLTGGHVLLEDIPGVGKTLLAKTLALALGGSFGRIQCTPDLTPSDILGYSVYNPVTGGFDFREGPVMAQVLLVDEINRASPRTQSALLQAMAEGEVTREGKTDPLPQGFFMMATQNPVEFEGTYPLPEAQKDRFLLSFSLGLPTRDQEKQIMASGNEAISGAVPVRTVSRPQDLAAYRKQAAGVTCDPKILDWILDLALATRDNPSLALGISPRGTQALTRAAKALAALRGRTYVVPEDVKDLFIPCNQQRILVQGASSLRGQSPRTLLEKILQTVPLPVLKDI